VLVVHVGVLISELDPPRLASLGCQHDGLLPAAAEGVQGQFVLSHRGLDFEFAIDPDSQVHVHRRPVMCRRDVSSRSYMVCWAALPSDYPHVNPVQLPLPVEHQLGNASKSQEDGIGLDEQARVEAKGSDLVDLSQLLPGSGRGVQQAGKVQPECILCLSLPEIAGASSSLTSSPRRVALSVDAASLGRLRAGL
jgi:hypothetical protein